MVKRIIIIFLFVLCLFAGCKENEKNQIELLPAPQEHFYYTGSEEADRLAVDEQGLLYTMTYLSPDISGPIVMEEGDELPKYYKRISVYDLEGNCIKSELVEAGNGIWSNMVLKDEVLYCVMDKSEWDYGKGALFAIDTKEWTVKLVKQLPDFNTVEYIEIIGDYLYLLGEEKEERLSEDEISTLDDAEYRYRNNRVARINITEENPAIEKMKVDFPMAMYRTEQNTLVLYRYSQESGRGFLEFHPEQGSLVEHGWLKGWDDWSSLSACGEGFLYKSMNDNMTESFLYYGTMDGLEAQIWPDHLTLLCPAVYEKGFAFFINSDEQKGVERICLENTLQTDHVLRILKMDDNQETAFGCGFLTENIELDYEAFALKVLARDADYDLFLLSSRDSVSYNIKEKGAFYPLNEIEGVQEYLDACFPYIKELATDEDGNVWMIPVVPAVYGMVYNKEFCAENNVDFSDMGWAEFVNFSAEVNRGNGELISCSFYVLREQFFAQYLCEYDTFDTMQFRNAAKQFRDIIESQGEWYYTLQVSNQIGHGQIPDFYYNYIISSGTLERYYNKLGESSAKLGVSGLPKISEDIGNVATIAFLAVNPESDNLETALEYVSAFAKYMVTKQDSFILADENLYTDAPFIRETYEMYANAEVYFMMDADVYWHDFSRYLNGEMELEELIAKIERKYKLYIGE